MSNIPNRESALEWARLEFERAKIYAQYWIASATNGHSTRRDIGGLRESTPEEKERGLYSVRVDMTESEKIDDAMNTANVHINKLIALQGMIMSCVNDNYDTYKRYQEML